jgi:hypothetical protein
VESSEIGRRETRQGLRGAAGIGSSASSTRRTSVAHNPCLAVFGPKEILSGAPAGHRASRSPRFSIIDVWMELGRTVTRDA